MSTLLGKLWDQHEIIRTNDAGESLLYIDRHLIHEASSPVAFELLEKKQLPVIQPGLTFATLDHLVSTQNSPKEHYFIERLRANCKKNSIFLLDGENQGIAHITAAELGLVLPGATVVCGDSHTCTLGALGALAFGIGTTEIAHVLATQALWHPKPKPLRINFNGKLSDYVTAKDLILYLIGKVGSAYGTGYATEYSGSTIRAFSMEERFTICNLSIEFGARYGFIAPDSTTFSYLYGKPFAPKDALWDEALKYWGSLYSDSGKNFDRDISIDSSVVAPQVTWGTKPNQVIGIDENIPSPQDYKDSGEKTEHEKALAYMGLTSNTPIVGTKIDWAFIGSCANSRISDLRAAASILKNAKIAAHVTAIVVPGSMQIKKQAENEGLDKIFIAAGCEWRSPGCSLCVAMNGDQVPRGKRCISTSNRNFEGRQGAGSRTHLASPTVVAISAIKGYIADPRQEITHA